MGLFILFLFAGAVIVAIATWALIHRLQHPRRLTYAAALAHHLPTDPRELNLEAEECSFVLDDDSRAPGWVIRGNKRDGPTVILVHGWSDSRYGSLSRAPLYVPHASRVIVYDLRGHGDHTANRCELTAQEPEDLIALMRQVDDGSPFVLAGQSMGAGVVIVVGGRGEVAEDRTPLPPREGPGEGRAHESEDVATSDNDVNSKSDARPSPNPSLGGRGIISSDPTPHTPHPTPSLRILAVIVESAYRHMMEPVRGMIRRRRWPAQPIVWLADQHIRFWLGRRRGADRRSNGSDRATHAAKLRCPLLVLHGEIDHCSLPDSARAIAAAAPDATLVMFPGLDHVNLALGDPARYAHALKEFFAKLEAIPRHA